MAAAQFPLFSLDLFSIINLIGLLISIIWFGYIIKFERYLIIKPSFIFLLYSCLFFQIPLGIWSYDCEQFLPNPYSILVLVHGFVLTGLFLTSRLFIPQTKMIWSRLISGEDINKLKKSHIFFLVSIFSISVLLFCVYLLYVSLADTPLMLLLQGHDHVEVILSRETSLKTLDNPIPKYAYSILRSTFSLFTVAFGSYFLIFSMKEKKYYLSLLFLGIILISLILSAVVLNKSMLSILLFSVFLNFIWMNIRLFYRVFVWAAIGSCLVFFLAMIVTLISYQQELVKISESIMPLLNRIFMAPLRVGTWYVHYGQVEGFCGISYYPKLANIFGEEAIVLPQVIAQIYATVYYNHPVIPSASANAGFIFNNYAAWGVISLPLNLLMLFSLDVALLVMKRLSKDCLIPFLSVIGVQLISFTSSNYGVCIISHGYLISLFIMYLYTYADKLLFFSSHILKRSQFYLKDRARFLYIYLKKIS